MTAPLVSILIPTYNRARYVGDAIRSALGQTLADSEVIVVDDGSTDATPALLAGFADPRLKVIQHATNQGIPTTRNTALAAATGRYIAWLDSDDVARPTRLAEQVAFLDANPAVAMVGACAGKLRPDGSRKGGVRVPPLSSEAIAAWLLFRSAFQQSAVTGRADVLQRYRYDADLPVCEDVDMFHRLQRDHRLANLPRVLIDRRLHPEQAVRLRQQDILDRKAQLCVPMLRRLGIEPTAEETHRHGLLAKADLSGVAVPADFLSWTRVWLARLLTANRERRLFDTDSLALACAYVWAIACRAVGGAKGVRAFAGSSLAGGFLSAEALSWARRAAPIYASRT